MSTIVEWQFIESDAAMEALLVCYGADRRRLTDGELDEQIRWFEGEGASAGPEVEAHHRVERAWRDRLEAE